MPLEKKKSSKKIVVKRRPRIGPVPTEDLLSSSSTLVNLASTGRTTGAWAKGHYYFMVGDSNSGKTWLLLGTLAEACRNPEFDDYQLIFVNAEHGAMMDIRRFFGEKLAKRLEIVEDMETLDQFYFWILDKLKAGEKLIVVLDSESALTTIKDNTKFEKTKRTVQKGDKATGQMSDGHAALHSLNMRRLCSRLHKTGSMVFMIGQARDEMNPMSYETQRHSGGRSLKFYAASQLWTKVFKKLKKEVRGKKREQGTLCEMRFKKNRIVGRDRSVTVPIYHSFGIDDIGSNIDYLIDEGHWKGGQTIDAKEFGVKLAREKLIQHIESESLEKKLRILVGKVWNEIEEACSIKRKPRYV